jgi:hypothetical protein
MIEGSRIFVEKIPRRTYIGCGSHGQTRYTLDHQTAAGALSRSRAGAGGVSMTSWWEGLGRRRSKTPLRSCCGIVRFWRPYLLIFMNCFYLHLCHRGSLNCHDLTSRPDRSISQRKMSACTYYRYCITIIRIVFAEILRKEVELRTTEATTQSCLTISITIMTPNRKQG